MSTVKIRVYQTKLDKVLTLDIEDYLLGVVPNEMSEYYPVEALKVQAICARTYALRIINSKKGSGTYDVVDTSANQVYKPVDKAKYPKTTLAVAATRGMVLTYNGALASGYFSASNGGRTYSSKEVWGGDLPYLVSRKDDWNRSTLTKLILPKKGHGVGMSQRGAQYAAQVLGLKYNDILEFYYPNTDISEDYNIPVDKPVEPPKPPVQPKKRILSNGSVGADVKVLQRALDNKGADLRIDGIFGNQTEKAVRAFQAAMKKKNRKFIVDGIVGPQTREALGI